MATTPLVAATSRNAVTPTLVATSIQKLISVKHRDSLAAWFALYLRINGGSVATLNGKQRDLHLFLDYLAEAFGTDHPDQWTKSITKGFVAWLEEPKGQKPTSVNRRLATIKHAAKWIEQHRPFLAGLPTEGVSDLEEDAPDWQGLTDIQVTRLKSAAEQLIAMKQKHRNQKPYRTHAYFTLLLRTGLRCSELLSLNLDNYQGKHLVNIRRKGKQRTRKMFLPTEAREAIDAYINNERGTEVGALFLSNRVSRWSRGKAHDALQTIGRQANAHLPSDEQFAFSAHTLRHTFLRKLTEAKGIQYTQQVSGHTSYRHLFRYVQPSKVNLEEAQERLF